VTFETILLIAGGVLGVVLLGIIAVVFLGFKDWMDRGSH
jgi:hypothetical protein